LKHQDPRGRFRARYSKPERVHVRKFVSGEKSWLIQVLTESIRDERITQAFHAPRGRFIRRLKNNVDKQFASATIFCNRFRKAVAESAEASHSPLRPSSIAPIQFGARLVF
jgi:hypothetical protein